VKLAGELGDRRLSLRYIDLESKTTERLYSFRWRPGCHFCFAIYAEIESDRRITVPFSSDKTDSRYLQFFFNLPVAKMGGVDFLQPILTPAAFAVVSASPELLITLILVLISMTVLCLVVWVIHWRTEKAYPKAKAKDGKKKGLLGRLGFGKK
jgi:hypothetical protein